MYYTVRQAQGTAELLELIPLFLAVALPMHMLFRPVVADIHLKLPPEARRSTTRLSEYVKNLPKKEPVLTFTTLSFFGLPSRTEESLDDLRVAESRFGDTLRPTGETSNVTRSHRRILFSQKQNGLFRGKYEAIPGGEGEKASDVKGIWSEIFKRIQLGTSSKEAEM